MRLLGHDLASLAIVFPISLNQLKKLLRDGIVTVQEVGKPEILHEDLGERTAAAATEIDGPLLLKCESIIDQVFEYLIEVVIHRLVEHELLGVVCALFKAVPVFRHDDMRCLLRRR